MSTEFEEVKKLFQDFKSSGVNEGTFNLIKCFRCLLIDRKAFINIVSKETTFEDCEIIQGKLIKYLDGLLLPEYQEMKIDYVRKLERIINSISTDTSNSSNTDNKNCSNLVGIKDFLQNLGHTDTLSTLMKQIDAVIALVDQCKNDLESDSSTFIPNSKSVQAIINQMHTIKSGIMNYPTIKTALIYSEIQCSLQKVSPEYKQDFDFSCNLSENFSSIREHFSDVEAWINDIFNCLACLRYALSDTVSKEIIYAVAYIPNQELLENAPHIKDLLSHHTELYRNVFKALPHQKVQRLAYVTEEQHTNKLPEEITPLVYDRLRSILDLYYLEPCAINKLPSGNECIDNHFALIKSISMETCLLNSKIRYSIDSIKLLREKIGITNEQLAKLFNVSKATIGRKDKHDNVSYWIAMSYFFDFTYDFIQLKTTIPNYGKIYYRGVAHEALRETPTPNTDRMDEIYKKSDAKTYKMAPYSHISPSSLNALLYSFESFFDFFIRSPKSFLKDALPAKEASNLTELTLKYTRQTMDGLMQLLKLCNRS